jgi:hypothetical protein
MILTWTLDGGEWSASRAGRFTPRESESGIQWIGGWVGPRASLEEVEKTKLYAFAGNQFPIVQPEA